MITLPRPRSSVAKILKALIERREIKERHFSINSFRDIIHYLKCHHKIPLKFRDEKGKSEFGKVCVYRIHYLPAGSKAKATRKYLLINKD